MTRFHDSVRLPSGGRRDGFTGSISLLITGDEEGPAVNGTVKVLDWMKAKGEIPDHCLLGEPSNREVLGDVVTVGRRGSIDGRLAVRGTQGHTAYPQFADNPTPKSIETWRHRRCAEAGGRFDLAVEVSGASSRFTSRIRRAESD